MQRTHSRSTCAALALLLLAGAALRVAQWAGATSLWIDELMLARNLLERDLGALVGRPLAEVQVAPAGYLALAKLSTALFGDGERALRLPALAGSIASLILLWRVATRYLSGLALVAAVAVCAASPGLIHFGSQVKQYATDGAAVLALLLLALRHREAPDDLRRAAGAGVAGSCLVLLSHPALLAAAGLGLALLVERLRSAPPRDLRPILALGAGWLAGAVAGGSLALATLSPRVRAHMLDYWADSFPPPPWRSLCDALWLPRVVVENWATLVAMPASSDPLTRGTVAILALATLFGTVALARRRPWRLALVAAPVAAAVTAAALQVLPFRDRVGFWCAPLLVLVAFYGLDALREALPHRTRPIGTALIAGVSFAHPVLVLANAPPFPWPFEDSRPVLAHIAREWRGGDVLYVHSGGRRAMRYYGPRVGLTQWTAGRSPREDRRALLRELDAFRGRPRVWVFWTHAPARYGGPEAIRSYLGTIGLELSRFESIPTTRTGGEAQALLYDLSDAGRLARATAEGHPLPDLPLPETDTDAFCATDSPAADHAAGAARPTGTR